MAACGPLCDALTSRGVACFGAAIVLRDRAIVGGDQNSSEASQGVLGVV